MKNQQSNYKSENTCQRGLFWFRHDLRLHDNAAISALCDEVSQVTFVYILDDKNFTPNPFGISPMGEHRHTFLLQTLIDLKRKLAKFGHELLVAKGSAAECLVELLRFGQYTHLGVSQYCGYDETAELNTVKRFFEKLTVIEQDAMTMDFGALCKEMPVKDKKLRVFGNLPYNISTPLMFHLFDHAHCIEDMHFMLQKEVVNRLAAGPGSKNYGRLSVMAQYYCHVIPVLNVPPGAFKPPPKVDSAVVKLVPHQAPPVDVESVNTLERVCAQAFNQRRKTIRNSLKDSLSEEEIRELGIDPTSRAEVLSLNDFATIANAVSAKEHQQEQ